MEAMGEEFERELAHSLQRLREAIAPYIRFIRAEKQKLTHIESELAEISASLARLRSRIENL
jgi:ubiquinone biosynthesis protein UbiJ